VNRNAKSFKKPQLLIKSKLNKYITETGDNCTMDTYHSIETDSFDAKVECSDLQKFLPKSESSVSDCIRNEQDSNIFFIDDPNSSHKGIIRLKDLKITFGEDPGQIVIQPVFEVINLDTE